MKIEYGNYSLVEEIDRAIDDLEGNTFIKRIKLSYGEWEKFRREMKDNRGTYIDKTDNDVEYRGVQIINSFR